MKSFREVISADSRCDVQIRAFASTHNICEAAAVVDRVTRLKLSESMDLVTRRDLTATAGEGLGVAFAFVIVFTGGGITWFAAASAFIAVAAVEGGGASKGDEAIFGVEAGVEAGVEDLMVIAEIVDDSPLAVSVSGAR